MVGEGLVKMVLPPKFFRVFEAISPSIQVALKRLPTLEANQEEYFSNSWIISFFTAANIN
jgi:hypothetical protein